MLSGVRDPRSNAVFSVIARERSDRGNLQFYKSRVQPWRNELQGRRSGTPPTEGDHKPIYSNSSTCGPI